MKKLSGNQIRSMWLDFFKSKGHEIIASAPLIPYEDPTLLWINAGIAPLKKFFDGREIPNNPRMVNAQKSIRTNDIDNVGKTARHHTFFEMLGNFSIGDYFRDEALAWAMEILFSDEWFGFDQDRIYITYYPTDLDTFNQWISLGIKEDHLIPLEGNFWEIGEGPCGPCTEIFYDRGSSYDSDNLGVRMLKEDIDNERYVEIWNIVLSQFNAKPGLTRSQYPELPSKNIDTGMGLERMACIMQAVDSNYDTDLFLPLIKDLEAKTKTKYKGQMSFRVIADHIRSVTFALGDGAVFSNEARGYVLRRILRRAIRYGKKIGFNQPFLYQMVPIVIEIMREYYDNLTNQGKIIAQMIKIEEENFFKTLENGEKRLLDMLNQSTNKIISGQDAFLLYDTFGFPLELTEEIAQEHGFNVDTKGFFQALEQQKIRARTSRQDVQSMSNQNEAFLTFTEPSEFIGYDTLKNDSSVIGLFVDGYSVNEASKTAIVIVRKTCFYAESGGQIGDTGSLIFNDEKYSITNTFKLPQGAHAHVVELNDAKLKIGDLVSLSVNAKRRNNIARNHTATHLLNQALRNHLGPHVVQQGSQVSDKMLRFDFNHYQNINNEEILAIEAEINQVINKGFDVKVLETSMEEAQKMGAQALFGEKYGDIVRVIENSYSIELCGGTHVNNTKDLKRFAILSIESKGSGLYRIEATTHDLISEQIDLVTKNIKNAIDDLMAKIATIKTMAKQNNIALLAFEHKETKRKDSYEDVINLQNEYYELQRNVKELEKTYEQKYRALSSADYQRFLASVKYQNDKAVLITKVEGLDINVLKDIIDKVAEKITRGVLFFANVTAADKIVFIAKAKKVSVDCGNLVRLAAIATGGNGGGRKDFAQAGGKDVSKLDDVLKLIEKEIKSSCAMAD